MAGRILDQVIMLKLARKLGKKDTSVINKIVYGLAMRRGVSSEEALIQLARKYKIGTSKYQRKLVEREKDTKVLLPNINVSHASKYRKSNITISQKAQIKASVASLIQDVELRERCEDLLIAPKNFDRAINQATMVLENRIRQKVQPSQKLVGEGLVGYAFSENITKSILKVSSQDTDDQRGFTQILRGIVPTFRNKTHHHVTSNFSREDALRVCGFIDVLLRIVDSSTK